MIMIIVIIVIILIVIIAGERPELRSPHQIVRLQNGYRVVRINYYSV